MADMFQVLGSLMEELLRIVHRYGMLVDGMMQDVETRVNLSVRDFHKVTRFQWVPAALQQ